MISFKQFIQEDSEPKVVSFQELLHGDCKQYFQQSKQEGLLFRGQSGYGTEMGMLTIGDPDFDDLGVMYYKKMVRTDRKPMSTKGPVHKVIDDWFEEEMGMRARSQAVFCYGERGRESAAEYGDRSIILPIGKFIYCWSPEVKDLYEIIRTKMEDDDGNLRPRFLGSDRKPDAELISDFMGELGYTFNDFAKACVGNSEIMIECKEYYVIPYHGDDELALLKKAFVHA